MAKIDYRVQFLRQIGANGYAQPLQKSEAGRRAEMLVLDEMGIEGLVTEEKRQADRYGFLDPKGLCTLTVYIATEKGLRLGKATRAASLERASQ